MTDVPRLLDAQKMEENLQRLSREITAAFGRDESLALLGIRTRGLHLAERLAKRLEAALGREVPLGVLDITGEAWRIVERRCPTVSKPTPKRSPSRSMS